jgi:hypothetical protein
VWNSSPSSGATWWQRNPSRTVNKQQSTGIFAAFRKIRDEIFLCRDDQFHHLQTYIRAGERSSSLPASLLDSASCTVQE